MSYLLDTYTISEFARPVPDPRLLAWLESQPESSLYTSAVVLGELARGVARLEEGSKKRRLNAWLHGDLPARFADRVLGVTAEIALSWGRISGEVSGRGITVSMADGLIGATAIIHSLTVVTRNVGNIAATGALVLNPWEDV